MLLADHEAAPTAPTAPTAPVAPAAPAAPVARAAPAASAASAASVVGASPKDEGAEGARFLLRELESGGEGGRGVTYREAKRHVSYTLTDSARLSEESCALTTPPPVSAV